MRRVPLFLLISLAIGVAGCNYTFQAGAGLPSHVRTLAIVPFENETGRFELPQELNEALLNRIPRAFGVRNASEANADAIIRGTVRRYNVEAPSYRAGAGGDRTEVLERQVNIAVEIQVIDRTRNVILWENTALVGRGEYLEASQFEEDGRRLAIDRIVQGVIDGLQSNW